MYDTGRWAEWRARVERAAAAGRTAWFAPQGNVTWQRVVEASAALRTTWTSILPPSGGPYRVAMEIRDPRLFLTAWLAWMPLDVEVLPLHPRWTDAEKVAFLERFPAHARVVERRGALDMDLSPAKLPPVEDPAALLLATSGSTGAPKAVLLDASALQASTLASCQHLGLREQDRWQTLLPLAHMGGIAPLLRMGWTGGGLVHTPEPHGEGRSAAVLHRETTAISVVPLVLRRWLDSGMRPTSSLRFVLCGGAATPEGWLREALEAGWPVLTTWGMTETASQVASVRPGQERQSLSGAGELLPGVRVRFRASDGTLADQGEIEVASPTLFRGYRGDERSTTRVLKDGWLVTGDLGRMHGGTLQVLGRRDALIIRGGENVHPEEVENALRRLPGVTDACVVGVPSERWGEEPVAIVLEPGAPSLTLDASVGLRPLDPEAARALTALARRDLAAFRVPAAWYAVNVWPRTASGKLDRKVLREAVLAGDQSSSRT